MTAASPGAPRRPADPVWVLGVVLLGGLLAVAGYALLVHAAVLTAAALTGHDLPLTVSDSIRAVKAAPANPLAGYPPSAGQLPPAGLVWALLAFAVLLLLAAGAAVVWWRAGRRARPPGVAARGELAVLGERQALATATVVRPSLAGQRRPDPAEALMWLCADLFSGRDLWAQHEDSVLVVGPPRMGKTLYVCVGLVLDAAGPVVATSTKADLLLLTAARRTGRGPVLAFDPEDVGGWPDRLRWSPVAGCEDPAEALRRAAAFVAARPLDGARNAGFFAEAAGTVLRCLLHAAALSGKTMRDVLRWAGDFDDPEPLQVLRTDPRAPVAWADELRGFTQAAAPETVAGTKMSVALILKSLADPKVLDACSPGPGEHFDVQAFVRGGGTLYVLSEGAENNSTAPLVTALADHIAHVAKRISQRYPAGRLDPPLRLVLDEAANICPLPGLPALMSDSGGRGITTAATIQSFAQARRRWGRDGEAAMRDAATIKLVLGGLSQADDLDALSRLCGEWSEPTHTVSHDGNGRRSVSSSTRKERVLPAARIRGLPPGEALLLYRNLPPALVRLRMWRDRPDAAAIQASYDDAHRLTGRHL